MIVKYQQIKSIHVTQKNVKGECSATRDIQQHVSSSLFRPYHCVSLWWLHVPIELSIASIPEDGKDPEVICLTLDHSNLLTTAKDSRSNRGNFCHLAQGNRGLIVIKGSDHGKFFEMLGFYTINFEMLPHFRDSNDRTLPDHLHDEVHEDYDISECTMVKSYLFARYLQHFNTLQAECKKQTAHLVE
ncbi:hypothetical protein TNCV_2560371 [Trichonephila clavipes]|uniref:Uncharacterized protein n=1 Tax=Trichonephila clavipes TaxID=2585209 RepID=A0A8X6R256_TRICX|nr:hypothetical protein TNCV_2560371 [Trichonephila clavipes]